MIVAAGCILLFACNSKTGDESKMESEKMETKMDSTGTSKFGGSEFADAKYMDMGKSALKHFENGEMDDWMNQYADNAVYSWSSGDSLAGKKAIGDYWKNRRGNVIDSIKFTNDIWLPIKINQPQRGPDMPGNWLLSWYQVDVKYKGAKKLMFWVHTDIHYNNDDKVDRVIQYIDRAPINAAMAGK